MKIQQIFHTLTERLEQVEQQWQKGSGLEEVHQELQELRQISEEIIEAWLSFEERLSHLQKQIRPGTSQESEQAAQLQQLATALITEDEEQYRYRSAEEWRKGKAYYDLMMFEHALPHLELALKKYPDFEYARLLLGHSYLASGHVDKARYHLQFLTETSSDRAWEWLALHALACMEGDQQNFDQALYLFRKIDFDDLPQDWKPVFFMNYIQTLYSLQLDEECLEELQTYYRSYPFDWQAPYMIGCILIRSQDHESGLAYWFQALQLEEHPHLLKAMARHFEQQQCHQVAAQCYERLLQRDTSKRDTEGWFGLAWNYGLARQQEKSRAAFLKALSLSPQHIELQVAYTWMLLYWREWYRAEKNVRLLKKNAPDHPLVNGLVFLNEGKLEAALDVIASHC
jgi:tetratricopeptide (TPR) repeat protein